MTMFDVERQVLMNLIKDKQAELEGLQKELEEIRTMVDKSEVINMCERLKEAQIGNTLGEIAGVRRRLIFEYYMSDAELEKALEF